MLSKKLEVHPNVIIRKKLKSKAKLGKMLLQIYDEKIAGVYPLVDHGKRLRSFQLHQYTWDDAFKGITKKDGKKVIVDISDEDCNTITTCVSLVEHFKSLSKVRKNIMENVIISLLREK